MEVIHKKNAKTIVTMVNIVRSGTTLLQKSLESCLAYAPTNEQFVPVYKPVVGLLTMFDMLSKLAE